MFVLTRWSFEAYSVPSNIAAGFRQHPHLLALNSRLSDTVSCYMFHPRGWEEVTSLRG